MNSKEAKAAALLIFPDAEINARCVIQEGTDREWPSDSWWEITVKFKENTVSRFHNHPIAHVVKSAVGFEDCVSRLKFEILTQQEKMVREERQKVDLSLSKAEKELKEAVKVYGQVVNRHKRLLATLSKTAKKVKE
jgi:hypothetical protein